MHAAGGACRRACVLDRSKTRPHLALIDTLLRVFCGVPNVLRVHSQAEADELSPVKQQRNFKASKLMRSAGCSSSAHLLQFEFYALLQRLLQHT